MQIRYFSMNSLKKFTSIAKRIMIVLLRQRHGAISDKDIGLRVIIQKHWNAIIRQLRCQ